MSTTTPVGGGPPPGGNCAVIYWTRLGYRYMEGPMPWDLVPGSLISIANAGGDNADPVFFPCGTAIPPDPNPLPPVVTNPQPPTPEPPQPPIQPGPVAPEQPTDSLTIIIELLSQLVIVLKNLPQGGPGTGCGCDKQLTNIETAVRAVANAVASLTIAVKAIPGPTDDPVTCTQLSDLFNSLVKSIDALKPPAPPPPVGPINPPPDVPVFGPADAKTGLENYMAMLVARTTPAQ